ncbi:cytoplasmic 60S subunit biogenesis factor ZNF622 [Diabrotica virgifera virgifera]|uniref:Zinc finger protein 622-like n=2 Tax=Diabrotica virgifera virgifera TaxID=50390 RepID=A0A6P7GSF7_DIAVI|nr:cytoplasmic 60S subunit biogenesis factor ZNF622 [Diabrotica virgifera virgifera]
MSAVNPSKDSFTCISCRVAFKDAELQRKHYTTDWHRYNLKRKVAELPPVTAEEFQIRVLNQRKADEIATQDKSVYCSVCRKSFGNQNAYDNHLNSKKHKDNEKSRKIESTDENIEIIPTNKPTIDVEDEDMETEEVDSDEWDDVSENPIDNNDCLFCSHHSGNFYKNLDHMTIVHSFFIPDIEYCSDLQGLLRYLGDKISEGFMCLWCNEKGKTFHTAEAAKQHMVDRGHCKMIHEGVALAEYADFYDYSTSYPDADAENIDADEEVTVPELDGSDYQLVLPSGVTIGHRSLMRYYKQSLNPNKALAVVPSKNNKKLHKVLAQYRALGWTETQQAAAAKKARDLHFLKRMQSKYNMKMGMRNNSLLQTHFRRQVQF